jgi:hypothetical protein
VLAVLVVLVAVEHPVAIRFFRRLLQQAVAAVVGIQ